MDILPAFIYNYSYKMGGTDMPAKAKVTKEKQANFILTM